MVQQIELPPNALELVGANRRREPRINTRLAARCTQSHAAFAGLITNASSGGLQLEISQEVAAGSDITVALEGVVLIGQIRYCFRQGDGFAAGVKVHTMGEQVGTRLLRVPLVGDYLPQLITFLSTQTLTQVA